MVGIEVRGEPLGEAGGVVDCAVWVVAAWGVIVARCGDVDWFVVLSIGIKGREVPVRTNEVAEDAVVFFFTPFELAGEVGAEGVFEKVRVGVCEVDVVVAEDVA